MSGRVAPVTPKRKRAPPTSPPKAPTKRKRPRASEALEAEADAEVQEYLGRFRGAQQNDAAIMTKLRAVAAGGPDGNSGLYEFIKAYGVVRTFAGLRADSVQCLAPIVHHLRSKWPALQCLQPEAAVAHVEALAEACVAAGFHRNTSFASKALNMLGCPVPLYSSEGKAYCRLPASAGYCAFMEAWTREYEPRRAAYETAAAARLDGDAPLERALGPAWFAMRGFDVHLLAVGGPMRK
jgi:hypothetical protein